MIDSDDFNKVASLTPTERFSTLLRDGRFLWKLVGAFISVTTAFLGVFVQFQSSREALMRRDLAYDAIQEQIDRSLFESTSIRLAAGDLLESYLKTGQTGSSDPKEGLRRTASISSIQSEASSLETKLKSIGLQLKQLKYNSKTKWDFGLLTTPAYADYTPLANSSGPPQIAGADTLRLYVMIVIYVVIALFLFVCMGVYFFSTDPEKLKFSSDMIRMIIGFFIGVGATLFGLPSK